MCEGKRSSLIRRSLLSGVVLATSGALAAVPGQVTVKAPAPDRAESAENYGKLPLAFEINQGQADPGVKFLSRGSGYSLFLTGSEAVLALGRADCKATAERQRSKPVACVAAQDSVRMRLTGAMARRAATATGEAELPGKVNYFIGNDPTRWHSDLPTYAKVRYSRVYPGIDLVYYGRQGQLEYDFVVAPGADPNHIRLSFAGEKDLSIAANGDLVLRGEHGSVAFHKPVVYQEKDGQRQPVAGNFQLMAKNTVGFGLGSYDHTRDLIIDPVLVYSTYLGGSGSNGHGDQGNGIAVDSNGNAYVVGTTYSSDFPVTGGAFQLTNNAVSNGSTVFISELNATGTALVYSTYLGGSGGDFGYGIALDSSNNAYITGATYSQDFPVTCGAFQTSSPSATSGAPTAFVTKLNPSGSKLQYSTYLGGSGNHASPASGDVAQAIAVIGGNAYVTGYTYSPDFPTTDAAFQPDFKGSTSTSNAFVTKLNTAGTTLMYSTYLGGSGSNGSGDYGNALALDGSGDVFVTGSTGSPDFPVTSGAVQTSLNGASTAFVTELNPTGTEEVFSTYLGGSGGDTAQAIAIDSSGDTYISGSTNSSDFPLVAAGLEGINSDILSYFGNNGMGGSFGFVTKLNPGGSAFQYSTYLEGQGTSVTGLAVDGSGAAYIVGNAPTANSGNFGGFQETPDALSFPGSTGNSAFLLKVGPTASVLNYATLFGGSSNDGATALALDSANNVYVTGYSNSPDFPTTDGAPQTTNNNTAGSSNAWLSKFTLAAESSQTVYPAPPGPPNPLPSTVTAYASITGSQCDGEDDSYYDICFGISLQVAPGGPDPTGWLGLTQPIANAVPVGGDPGTCYNHNFLGGGGGVSIEVAGYYTGDSNYTGSSDDEIFNLQVCPQLSCPDGGCTDNQRVSKDFIPKSKLHLPSMPRAAQPKVTKAPAPVRPRIFGPKFTPIRPIPRGNARPAGTTLSVRSQATPACLTPAPTLTITVLPATVSRLYGKTNPKFTYKITGLLKGDTVSVTPQTTATALSPVGVYPVTATVSGRDAGKYLVSVANGALTVLPAPLTVSVGATAKIYGSASPENTSTIGIDFKGNFSASSLDLNGSAELTSNSLRLTEGQTFQAASSYFKTPISITKFSTSFTFRITDALSNGITFVLQNQGSTALGGTGGYLGYGGNSCDATTGGITPSAAIEFRYYAQCGEGYDSTDLYTDGLFPGVPTVDMSSSGIDLLSGDVFQVHLNYDGQNLAETITDKVTSSSFSHTYTSVNLPQILGGDTAYVGFTSGAGAGSYPSGTGYTDILSWSYSSVSKLAPYVVTGLVNDDILIVTESTPATASSPVGSYPITATVSGPALSNYTLTVVPGTLYVRPATLHIVASTVAVVYSHTPPALTAYVLTGFVNGDTKSVVSGAPILSTSVTSTTPPGIYKIGIQTGTLTAANYIFTGVSNGEGFVDVTRAPLALKANNLVMTRGGSVPTLTYSLTGFVNGQSAAGTVTGTPILTTTATSTSSPGQYPITITLGSLASTNYYFVKTNGILTVKP